MNTSAIKNSLKMHLPDTLLNCIGLVMFLPTFLKMVLSHDIDKSLAPIFLSDKDTVDRIVNEGASLSRFGDGEFCWILGYNQPSYQEYSDALAASLLRSINSLSDKLIIGLPKPFFDPSECTMYARLFWIYDRYKLQNDIQPLINWNRTFANACFTRPWIDYLDNHRAEESFKTLKRIWDGRDVVIVEGEKTRMGVGNDLYNNAKSIRRIVCPAENSFSCIEEIKGAIRRNVQKDSLILGALGPTASILAADLSVEGYQFVDVGHIDIEYSWFTNNCKTRRPVYGKYTNECGRQCVGDIRDDEYDAQIIERIR